MTPSPPEERLREFIEAAKEDVYGEAPDAEAALAELLAELRELQEALREIRKLDHDAFDTPFRYEQTVRGIAHRALAASSEEPG